MTDSRSSPGWKGLPSIWLRWSSFQLSFLTMSAPFEPCNSRTGSSSASLTPKTRSDGPMPRMTTAFEALPVMMDPAIMALSPVSTRKRVAMFSACTGEAVGVAVAVAVGVAVAVAAGVAVAVAVGVAVAVAVGVAVAVTVGVGVGVGVGGGELTT